MKNIASAMRALEAARNQLETAVQAARSQGRTWAEIGEIMGISRQAAFKRFGTPTTPSGETLAKRDTGGVVELTEKTFHLIAQGDFTALTKLMHPGVQAELNPEILDSTWRRVLGEVGTLEQCESTHLVLPGGEALPDDDAVLGLVVGVTTLVCEAGEVQGRVAVDPEGLIVGILIVPVDHGPVPF